MKRFLLLLCNVIILPAITHAQNVGVGIAAPSYKLHVNNSALDTTYMGITTRTTGTNLGDGLLLGVAGKSAIVANLENGNLRLGTNNLTRLTIDSIGNVGIGTFSPANKLDVVGDMNVSGQLKVNGSPGTVGQVLSSNGTSAPTWVNSAYTNNDRFGVFMEKRGLSFDSYLDANSVLYNENTTDILIGGTIILILKSGLYHFSGSYTLSDSIPFDLPAGYTPGASISLLFAGNFSHEVQLEWWRPFNARLSGIPFLTYTNQFSQDIYLNGGTALKVHSVNGIGSANTMAISKISLFGYRVSD